MSMAGDDELHTPRFPRTAFHSDRSVLKVYMENQLELNDGESEHLTAAAEQLAEELEKVIWLSVV